MANGACVQNSGNLHQRIAELEGALHQIADTEDTNAPVSYFADFKWASGIARAALQDWRTVKHCPKCKTLLSHAPAIGPFCPNKGCDVVDNIKAALQSSKGECQHPTIHLRDGEVQIEVVDMRYEVVDESDQVIALTLTKWTAERLLDGIRACGSPTSKLGTFSIRPLQSSKGDACPICNMTGGKHLSRLCKE